MKSYLLALLIFICSLNAFSQNEVGVTDGDLSVTQTGATTFSIPITVPPGINKVVPKISINYNSQSGNGMAGFGWNLYGISSITRIPSNKLHDGEIDPVDLDNLDRYALDGQRLIVKNGTSIYGADGVIYETENFSNVKVTSHGINSDPAIYGPAYFIVEYPDGSKAQYGNTSNSRSLTSWGIDYWENAQGVRINYTYDLENNSMRIKNITYGSISNNNPINEISFIYWPRIRPEQSYIGGRSIKNAYILKNINIIGNGQGYKNYLLDYETNDVEYQRLSQITEKTGDNSKSFNPTTFTYSDSSESPAFLPNTTSLAGTIPAPGSVTDHEGHYNCLYGEFDSDGKWDIFLYGSHKHFANSISIYQDVNSGVSSRIGTKITTGSYEALFSVNMLNGNTSAGYTFMPYNGWCMAKTDNSTNLTTISVNKKGTSTSNLIDVQYTIEHNFPRYCDGNGHSKMANRQYVPGDFNADGLTDVIIVDRGVLNHTDLNSCGGNDIILPSPTIYNSNTYFVDLAKNITGDPINFAGVLENVSFADGDGRAILTSGIPLPLGNYYSNIISGDVNGDGKTDLIVIRRGIIEVYTLNNQNMLVKIGTTTEDFYMDQYTPLSISDYNDDGKIDITVSNEIFLSTGTTFTLLPINETITGSWRNDYNNDGKTDSFYLSILPTTYKYSLTGKLNHKNVTFPSDYSIIGPSASSSGNNVIPMFSSYLSSNNLMSFYNSSTHYIHYISFRKDFSKEKLLTKITLGNGVTHEIEYASLSPNNDTYYSDGETMQYPFIDIAKSPATKVVSKIIRDDGSYTTYKNYKYHGAVSNIENGIFGFKSVLQTNWYSDPSKAISIISKYDPNKRFANTETFSVLGLVLPTLTYTSGDFIERTVKTYNVVNGLNVNPLLSNKVYKLFVTLSQNYNGLEGTSTEVSYKYDVDNMPTEIVTDSKSASTIEQKRTISFTYYPISTNPYILGNRKTKVETVTLLPSNLSTVSEESYQYDKDLRKQVKIKNNGIDDMTEDYLFYPSGNLQTLTKTALGMSPRTTNFQYDPTDRFVTKKIDTQLLETTYTNDPYTGMLLTETLPSSLAFPLITTYGYDKWFKLTSVRDYLNHEETISYSNVPSGVFKLTVNANGSSSSENYDKCGRKIRSGQLNVNGLWSYTHYQFDEYGRNILTSEPSTMGESDFNAWSEKLYDEYGRLNQEISLKSWTSDGKTIDYSYFGLTMISEDGQKTKTTVKNSIGKVVSLDDSEGGLTSYEYFPNGEYKNVVFDGAVTSTFQDHTGRKEKITDGSGGEFRYKYNPFGEVIEERSLKGIVTYDYDNTGKLKSKLIQGINGDLTNSKMTYTYHTITKNLQSTKFENFANGEVINCTYGYDDYRRPNFKDESSSTTYYQQAIQYDTYGREEKKLYSAISVADNKRSDRWVKNIYKNGALWKIVDDANPSLILWQINSVNAKRDITSATYGNGVTVTKGFSQPGLPTRIKYEFGPLNFLQLDYDFNLNRGILNSRNNSMFNWEELFEYDQLDRLTKWSGKSESVISTNFSTGLENFVTNNATLINDNGALKVTANNANANISRVLASQSISNDKFKVKLYVNKATTNNVRIIIVESNGAGQTQYFKSIATNGDIEFTHTVVNNGQISLLIEKGMAGDNGTATNYYIDNLTVEKIPLETQVYDNKGRITSNSSGIYNYTAMSQPFRLSSVKLNVPDYQYYSNRNPQKIKFNTFKGATQIEETNIDKIDFDYEGDDNRSAMYYGGLQADKLQRTYRKFYSSDASMEIKRDLTDPLHPVVQFITYIGEDPYAAPVILKNNGNGINEGYYYLHRDYLGSILAITNSSAQVVEKRMYDAWGAISKIQDGNGNDISNFAFLDRGYGGHEHLQSVGLINMNARLYDVKLHRFLQPDNNLQDPSNSQNFNRYSYVLNNPLIYTDRSGESLFGIITWALSAFIHGAAATGEINPFKWNATNLSSAVFGLASGYASNAATTYLNNTIDSSNTSYYNGEYSSSQSTNSSSAIEDSNTHSYTSGKATIYNERDGVGHTYVEVDGFVYSFGRYNGSNSPSMGHFGLTGDGVLLKLSGKNAQNFIAERTSKFPTDKLTITVNTFKVREFYDTLYNSGTSLPNTNPYAQFGRVIGLYNLAGPGGNNCTTLSYKALQYGGAAVPPSQWPYGMHQYIQQVHAIEQGYIPGQATWGPK